VSEETHKGGFLIWDYIGLDNESVKDSGGAEENWASGGSMSVSSGGTPVSKTAVELVELGLPVRYLRHPGFYPGVRKLLC